MVENMKYAHNIVAYGRLCLTDRQLPAVRALQSPAYFARAFVWKQVRLALIDYFSLTLVHGLLVIALFRLVQNDALDPAVKLPKRPKKKQTDPRASSDSALDHDQ